MNNEAAVRQLEEPELLNEVPPILKRLAKTVAYAFYEPEFIVTVSLLTKYPCIDEEMLLEKLQFDKRQLRQVLSRLKNDKLIKQRVIKEKQLDFGNFNIYNFYFINYKLLVNVVKYKLDHIRKKIENEEQQARNRPSFLCQICEKHYSDLEIDRLMDFNTGLLKCPFCGGEVEEDASHINTYSSGSSLGKFNEQMEMIFKLLRECENINLAPDVLEPTPSTAALKSAQSKSNTNSTKSGWSNEKSADIYEQSIQINVGDEVVQKEAKAPKELPLWLAQSTVFNEESNDGGLSVIQSMEKQSINQSADDIVDGDQIMSDLLAHESASKKSNVDLPTNLGDRKSDTSSDSELDSSPIATLVEKKGVTEVADMMDSDDDDDQEAMVKVGDKSYSLSNINDEIIGKMTPEEHEAYLKLYHEAYEQFY